MEWLRISTGTELVRVDTDRIVYVRTNNNNSDMALTNDKAKCRAIAHVDQFYYIATRHKETLWDFVKAFREYGFIDTIYITDGSGYVFYQDKYGIRHDIGDPADYPHTRWKGIVSWLLFRNKDKWQSS